MGRREGSLAGRFAHAASRLPASIRAFPAWAARRAASRTDEGGVRQGPPVKPLGRRPRVEPVLDGDARKERREELGDLDRRWHAHLDDVIEPPAPHDGFVQHLDPVRRPDNEHPAPAPLLDPAKELSDLLDPMSAVLLVSLGQERLHLLDDDDGGRLLRRGLEELADLPGRFVDVRAPHGPCFDGEERPVEVLDEAPDREALPASRGAVEDERGWELDPERPIALLVLDDVDDVLVEEGLEVGTAGEAERSGAPSFVPVLLPVRAFPASRRLVAAALRLRLRGPDARARAIIGDAESGGLDNLVHVSLCEPGEDGADPSHRGRGDRDPARQPSPEHYLVGEPCREAPRREKPGVPFDVDGVVERCCALDSPTLAKAERERDGLGLGHDGRSLRDGLEPVVRSRSDPDVPLFTVTEVFEHRLRDEPGLDPPLGESPPCKEQRLVPLEPEDLPLRTGVEAPPDLPSVPERFARCQPSARLHDQPRMTFANSAMSVSELWSIWIR